MLNYYNNFEKLNDYLAKSFAGYKDSSVAIQNKAVTVTTTPDSLLKVLGFLRGDENSLFKLLIDVFAVDYPAKEQRFEVIYNLLSIKHNARVTVKVLIKDNEIVPSVTSIYSTANWFEREAWDMHGILFSDHPDLRRILSDYGFTGHPLRKDFPLTGYVEVGYDGQLGRVAYKPVKLDQEYRNFDFISPWEGTKYVGG